MKTALCLFVFAFSSLLACAAEFRCCLPWEVVVVSEQGQPLPGCAVVQEWGYNFGRNATNFVEQTTTDAAGRVLLPQRGVAYPISLSERAAKRLMVRPGLGPWTSLFVWKRGYESQKLYVKHDTRVTYTTNGLFSRIVLHPSDAPQ